ncbi:leucyl/phenylalanyl-tRNA--protein transferase [Marinihelvus fidelis]|uniref:Leucyl/phenylalanyl-tRNA--protein transferase n=1 Tax=Marinihelvus fidelis TaxID=2613842 RepID=A0A5N0TDJ8_9GAMM|nr:leucyl/phenylalanyl-tRNA--protein transferase [Marinihelvus fidelis]KAA9131926.1 leucyl/phenylalanyl-tRNA--protein transferase [Marinihelvus fidelis]
MIPRLGSRPDAPFPPVDRALSEPDGLLAWGGDLSPRRLETAYRSGIFPWYSDDQPILWWSPGTRCVFDTARPYVSSRLARTLRSGRFRVTADTAFDAVVEACAHSRGETWITTEMRAAYGRMHELGHAHSLEAWVNDELVGGIYGLSFGRLFFGESMFSAVSDASKVALVSLCRVLHDWDFPWLDAQVPSGHLLRMGAVNMPRAEFLERQASLLEATSRTGRWTADVADTLARQARLAGNQSVAGANCT